MKKKFGILLADFSIEELVKKSVPSQIEMCDLAILFESYSNSQSQSELRREFPNLDIHIISEGPFAKNNCNYEQFFTTLNEVTPQTEAFFNTVHINNTRSLIGKLICAKDIVKSQGITDLLLFGGHPRVDYFSTFYAEGEVPFTLLYRPRWQLNPILQHYLKDAVNIQWAFTEPKFLLSFKKFLRRNILLPVKFLIYGLLKISHGFLKNSCKLKKTDEILLSIRSSSQLQSMEALAKSLSHNFSPIFVTHDLVQSPGITKRIQALGYRFLPIYPQISLFDFLRLSQLKSRILAQIKGVNRVFGICLKDFVHEIFSTFDEYEVKKNALKKILKKTNPKAMFSSETYGHTAFLEKEVCSEFGIPYYNVQNVIYEFDWIPRFPIADKTFMFSTESSFIPPQGQESCEVFGPVWLDQYFTLSPSYSEKKQIALFTQPDSYSPYYLRLIENLLESNSLADKNLILVVKPHPREKSDVLNQLASLKSRFPDNLEIASKSLTSIEVIQNSFAVMSISSSTLYESCLLGIPAIGYNPEGKHGDYNKGYLHLKRDYIYHLQSPEELPHLIDGLSESPNEWLGKRSTLLDELIPGYSGNAIERLKKSCQLA